MTGILSGGAGPRIVMELASQDALAESLLIVTRVKDVLMPHGVDILGWNDQLPGMGGQFEKAEIFPVGHLRLSGSPFVLTLEAPDEAF